ncbi:phospholipase D1/2 [Yoonia maritima]|uniref:Phospholipase D n=1 Tax=Yoonia maritima TaxID=1435347 RepID=A0A2T0VYN0_9RHOB|nr:phospholipase D family protein [Yoonia maritima]PRY77193.1 phospholipase D1/2 [Yoonia maritima]
MTADNAGGVTVLVTAKEAYPAFEALFLAAERKIELGFRIFDPTTKLRSTDALQVGTDWADLIVATLNRGVSIELLLSDFDPIVGYDLHRSGSKSIRILQALNDKTEPGAAMLMVRRQLHPAVGGIVPRMLFAPKTRQKLREIAEQMNENSDPASALSDAPGLEPVLDLIDGKVCVRPKVLPSLNPVTLHHKMAVFDGATTYVGGLDLNDRRYDDQKHDQPAQDTWHDVQLIIRDKAVARDASAFLQSLPDTIAGTSELPQTNSMFLRTLSRKWKNNTFALAPDNIADDLLQEHLRQIKAAKQLIYLETQFFRDRRIASALAKAGRDNPDLKLLLLLPAAPEDIAFEASRGVDARFGEYLQARAIRRVRRAFGDRFLAVSPVQPRRPTDSDQDMARAALSGAPIIYVHAKVSVFDDTSAIVSSANLNGRSMKWDAEAGVVLTNKPDVEAVRRKVLGHWLHDTAGPEFYDIGSAFDHWKKLAIDNATQSPETRSGFIVPYALAPAKAYGLVVPGAPEELV